MAGPDHGNGEVTTDDARTVRPRRPVPRKTAPIKHIRRKRPVPVVIRPEPPAPEQTPSVEPVRTTVPAETTSPEASPQRSGAALSYRERRRAGSPSDAVGRVVTKKTDRSRLGVALAAVVAGALIVGLVVVSVLFAMGTNRIDDRAAQRAQYSAFARQMIVNLTSLSPTTIDQVTNTFETKTSGKAQEQLQQSLQQTTDLVKSQGVTTKGTILSDAVVDSDADSATVMLVSGWTMNTPPPAAGAAPPPADQGPVVQTFRWKLSITKINGDMKMTDIQWVP